MLTAFRLCLVLLLPSFCAGRPVKIIPATPAEIAVAIVKKSVRLRMSDGSRIAGKVQRADAQGVTIRERKTERTLGWRGIAAVEMGLSRSTKALVYGLLAGSVVAISAAASAARPTGRHPGEYVSVGMLGGIIAVGIFGPGLEYRPLGGAVATQ
jgi:hypothetical protein